MQIAEIIEKFGGIRPMARITGYPVTTISWWKTSGKVTKKEDRDAILEAAKREGIELVFEQ